MSVRGVLLSLLLLSPAVAFAQEQPVTDELALLRDASAREVAGDFAGSRLILERILKLNPQSLSALLSYERVLRMEGRLADLIPFVEAHLKADQTSAIGHQMLVRAFSSLDQIRDLERAGELWVRATPKIETPYREIARVWQQRGEFTRALQYLELGRSRVGRGDALALELGDAYAGLEEYSRAVREWDRAIGAEARGLLLVQRRLATLQDGGAQVLPGLVDALMRAPASHARKRAAAQLAIDAGLSQRAEQVVREVASDLRGAERKSFLVEMARRSDAAQLPRVALWAYSQLTPVDMSADQMLAIRARTAELALAVGDTASAARSYRELEHSLAASSPQRRQAIALRIQLMAKEGRLAQAEQDLAAFRGEFPNARELDAVAATLASAYIEKDETERAEQSLAGVSGPRSSIARGRIALRRGDVNEAKAALLAAAPSLHGAEATETIRLVTLLGKVSRKGAELLGKSMSLVGAGSGKQAFTLLEKSVDELAATERASILDFAAAIADRSQLPLDAERARRVIVEAHPRSIEAPAALLALARSLTERGEAADEARQYLEKLIIEYPRSALVPQARQELDRLQGRVPRS
ncbi:MAG: tetratricopeptide repeat protein [Gemmatimonadota bacterium]